MIPRTEITAVKSRESIPEAFQIFESTGYSRLPVMKKNIDEIIGMITVKDLLLEKPDRLKQILRDLLFVPHTRLIASLLREMQQRGMGMAIVVDEYGGTAGLVTIEDIVEEFVGEIQDEFDGETRLYRKIAPMQIDANARVEIAELNERFGLHLPRGNFNTLGGLIMDTLGRIPKKGERIELPTCVLVILSAFKKKINWVRISIKSTH
jgi:CBS domain containing-hemolysin-like protein